MIDISELKYRIKHVPDFVRYTESIIDHTVNARFVRDNKSHIDYTDVNDVFEMVCTLLSFIKLDNAIYSNNRSYRYVHSKGTIAIMLFTDIVDEKCRVDLKVNIDSRFMHTSTFINTYGDMYEFFNTFSTILD